MENSDVLKALGLVADTGAESTVKEGAVQGAEGGAGPKVVCDEDVCKLEK